MIYQGHVDKGVVVLDDLVVLPDGAEVRIELVNSEEKDRSLDEDGLTLGQKLLKHAGKSVGMPPDLSVNHDRYLYGDPEK